MKYRFAVVVLSVFIFTVVHAAFLTADYGRHLAKIVDDTVKTIHATVPNSYITHADVLTIMCIEQRSLNISNSSAASRATGAKGLTQVTVNTFNSQVRSNKYFRDFVSRTNCTADKLDKDPRCSIESGARIFNDLLKRYNGDRNMAAGAYHGGPGAVISKTQYKGPKTTKYANEWFPACFNRIKNGQAPESTEVWKALVSEVARITGGTFGAQGIAPQLVQYRAGSDRYVYNVMTQNPVATNPMFGSLISTSYSPGSPGVMQMQVYDTADYQDDYFVLSTLYSDDISQDRDKDSAKQLGEKDKPKTQKDNKLSDTDTVTSSSTYHYYKNDEKDNKTNQLSFFGKLWSNFWGWTSGESHNEANQKQNKASDYINNSQIDSNQIQSADDFFGTAQSGLQAEVQKADNLNSGNSFNTNKGFLHCLPNQVLTGEPFLLAYSCPKNYTFYSSNFGADSDSGVKRYSLTESKTMQYSCNSDKKTIHYRCSISVIDPRILSFTIVGRDESVLQVKWETKDLESCKLLTGAMKTLREGVSGSVFIDANTLQSSSLQLICNSKSGTQVKKIIDI